MKDFFYKRDVLHISFISSEHIQRLRGRVQWCRFVGDHWETKWITSIYTETWLKNMTVEQEQVNFWMHIYFGDVLIFATKTDKSVAAGISIKNTRYTTQLFQLFEIVILIVFLSCNIQWYCLINKMTVNTFVWTLVYIAQNIFCIVVQTMPINMYLNLYWVMWLSRSLSFKS